MILVVDKTWWNSITFEKKIFINFENYTQIYDVKIKRNEKPNLAFKWRILIAGSSNKTNTICFEMLRRMNQILIDRALHLNSR